MNQDKIREMEHAIVTDYDNMLGIAVMKDGENVYERF